MKITLALFLLALPALAQTRTEFRQKYESPKADTYLVRQGIIMSVKFAAAPLWEDYACEAIIELENTTASNPTGPEVMLSELVMEIIDEVVPMEQRGKLINQLSVNGGCTGLKISIYENVTISRSTRCKQQGGGTYQGWIKWKASWCEDKEVNPKDDRTSPNKLLKPTHSTGARVSLPFIELAHRTCPYRRFAAPG